MFQPLTNQQCQQARLARDARFDGRFFIAVKTTGIFCRPICPANPPKETNVRYFFNAAVAVQAGYRPCLRCRPDSAPSSWAWQGTKTTFIRALNLIEQGALQHQSLPELSDRLGISDRYLRQLFETYLGMSPKHYAQIYQLMFAKQLLHNSRLSIADIADASGFNSIRRFNDAFKKHLSLRPLDVRKNNSPANDENTLMLTFQPPFDWEFLVSFYHLRLVQGVEFIEGKRFRRNIKLNDQIAWFEVSPASKRQLKMTFSLPDLRQLRPLITNVRRMFDLDANLSVIEPHLKQAGLIVETGLRIPGVWSTWEAGVRAILGQQVSVKAAITQLNRLVALTNNAENRLLTFPSPNEILATDLEQLPLPLSRRATLLRFAQHMVDYPDSDPDDWLAIKGIGPWTVNYARLRGLSEPDCFLETDLVVKKALAAQTNANPAKFTPWGSYATFHCWSSQT